MPSTLSGQLVHICFEESLTIRFASSNSEDAEHRPPTRPDVLASGLYHLDKASQNHVLDSHNLRVANDVLKRLQEVLLKLETR